MISCTRVLTDQLPIILFFMCWYCVENVIPLANYIVWVRNQTTMLTPELRITYITFVGIALVVYFAPVLYLFVRACMYHSGRRFMQQEPRARHYLWYGIAAVYFFADKPLFIIEFYIVYHFGYHHLLQTCSFLLKTISWLLGSVVVWVSYVWWMSRKLQNRSDAARTYNAMLNVTTAQGAAADAGGVADPLTSARMNGTTNDDAASVAMTNKPIAGDTRQAAPLASPTFSSPVGTAPSQSATPYPSVGSGGLFAQPYVRR